MSNPVVYIVAGPNGAGKTTFALDYLPLAGNCRNFINADLIADGLNPLDEASVEITAGKIFLSRIYEQINKLVDFSFETTLSGMSYVRLFERLKSNNYTIIIYYLWIPNVSFSAERVRIRVQNGGHNIPQEAIDRRYLRSLKNLFKIYSKMADRTVIINNAGKNPEMVCEIAEMRTNIRDARIYNLIMSQIGE